MPWSEIATYLWLLVPVAIYCAVAVVVQVLKARLPVIGAISPAIHLLALGLCLRLAVVYYLPPQVGGPLDPYSVALLIFAGMVLLFQTVEALVLGYFMGRLRNRKLPIVLRKAVLMVAYFVGALIIMHGYLHLNITSLVATSAVVSFVVGMAGQDLLGSILGGIALAVERPITKDNWVVIDGQEGRVVDVTWRRTRIETRDGDFVLVPNNLVMKGTITNFTMPDRRHRLRIKVGVHYRHPPNQVKASILAAARMCPEVLDSPSPSVFVRDFGDSAIIYRLNVWIDGLSRLEHISDEVRTHIWYQFQRDGIIIPFPIVTLHRQPPPADPKQAAAERAERILPHLRAAEVFAGMPPEALHQAAMTFHTATYGEGEVLFHQGDKGSSFYIILSGRASVIVQLADGTQTRLATLGPGDCFGEMSLLLDQNRTATVRLEEDSEVIEVRRDQFKDLVEAYPEVLDYLTRLVQERSRDNRELMALFTDQSEESRPGRMRAVLERIKSVLGL